jgi:hypothetical protein
MREVRAVEPHVTVDQKYWPLHSALAWVLRRDVAFAELATSSHFRPLLNRDGWESEDEVDCAWHSLHQSLADGTVPAIKVSLLCGNEESIAPEALASLTWDDLTEYSVTFVCSAAMRRFFPSDGDPAALTSDHIGPPVRPYGPGYMTLSDAAYWIATEGGTKRIVASDDSVWRQAFAELLPRIQSGEIRVVGRRRGADISEVINPESFLSLAVDHPYVDTPMALLLCEEPHIRCCGCGTAKLDQCSDELWGSDRRVPEWSHLHVDRANVRKWWYFAKARKGIQQRVNTEKQAIAALADALRENKDLTREEAKDLIGDEIGPRAFQNRVWPEARNLAGLARIAPQGAKRKNRHA